MTTIRAVPRTYGLSPGEAAAVWVARLDRGSISQSEEAEFAEWVADPSNDEALTRANEAFHVFDADRLTDPNLRAMRQAALKATPAPRRRSAYLVAAAIVMIGVGLVANRFPRTNSSAAPVVAAASSSASPVPEERPSRPVEYSSGVGQRRMIALADGSTITLNTNSRLSVSLTEGRRLIQLMQGQALFEVAHNPRRPFMVFAGDRRVTALGTVFEVRTEPSCMQVVLVKGAVVVDHGERPGATVSSKVDTPVLLEPGQAFVAARGKQRVYKVDLRRELLWRDGFVEFDDESLGRAVKELNRYASHPIELSPDGVADLRVSGVFRTDDPSRFFDTVGELLSLDVQRTNSGGMRLSRSKKTGQ